jgi:subtilisin family serine protease
MSLLDIAKPSALDMVNLRQLMALTEGSDDLAVGLIDGPVATGHPDLHGSRIRDLSPDGGGCKNSTAFACQHGTFVAGILLARRSSPTPGICPKCPLLVRPIFSEHSSRDEPVPSATPLQLATAIVECATAGARVLNLSASLFDVTPRGQHALQEAVDYAARRGVIITAAAGTQHLIGTSPITRHAWVIPVGAADAAGRPISRSTLAGSIGSRGVLAPGQDIVSLGTTADTFTVSGCSAAVPFVTGAIALLWSLMPEIDAGSLVTAVRGAGVGAPRALVPPVLNAGKALEVLSNRFARHKYGTRA